MVRKDIFDYKSKDYIMEKFDLDAKQYDALCEPFLVERAQRLIKTLTPLPEDMPQVIRTAIGKLSIIAMVASRLNTPQDIFDLTQLEKIENCAIKAELLNDDTWKGTDVVSEDRPITPEWVMMVENSTLSDQRKLSESIRDKILLKEYVKEAQQYNDWDAHVERCLKLYIDPTKHSEKDVILMEKRMKEFEDIDK